MEDELIRILEALKYPVIRQGSLSPENPYPETFFTFWNTDETGQSFYDNETMSAAYVYNVFAYSTNPSLAYELIRTARGLFKSGGWIITDRGFDAQSDEITHVGRGMSVAFLENLTIS